MERELPELYAYILRNVLLMSKGYKVVTSKVFFIGLRKVVYKAPKPVLRYVLYEFIHKYNILRPAGKGKKKKYFIVIPEDVEKQLERLKDYVFPLKI